MVRGRFEGRFGGFRPMRPELSSSATNSVVNQSDKEEIGVAIGYDGFIAKPVPALGQETHYGDGRRALTREDTDSFP